LHVEGEMKKIAILMIWAVAVGGSVAPRAEAQTDNRPQPSACRNHAVSGAIIGGVLGALAGGALSNRNNRAGGALLGGVGGALVGGAVGAHWTECDQQLAMRAATDAARDGSETQVTTPDNQVVTATPSEPVQQQDGRTCSDVRLTVSDSDGPSSVKVCKAGENAEWAPVQS
jgi:hypothetical protein